MGVATISGINGDTGSISVQPTASRIFDVPDVASLKGAISGAKHLVLDLFSGMGGTVESLDQLGLNLSDSHTVVISFEVDPLCLQILRKRASKHHRFSSIADWTLACTPIRS